MNRSMKFGVSLLVGLIVGAYFGNVYAHRTVGMGLQLLSQRAAGAEYAQLAHLQYRYADELHARTALKDFISFAAQMRAAAKVPLR